MVPTFSPAAQCDNVVLFQPQVERPRVCFELAELPPHDAEFDPVGARLHYRQDSPCIHRGQEPIPGLGRNRSEHQPQKTGHAS